MNEHVDPIFKDILANHSHMAEVHALLDDGCENCGCKEFGPAYSNIAGKWCACLKCGLCKEVRP